MVQGLTFTLVPLLQLCHGPGQPANAMSRLLLTTPHFACACAQSPDFLMRTSSTVESVCLGTRLSPACACGEQQCKVSHVRVCVRILQRGCVLSLGCPFPVSFPVSVMEAEDTSNCSEDCEGDEEASDRGTSETNAGTNLESFWKPASFLFSVIKMVATSVKFVR